MIRRKIPFLMLFTLLSCINAAPPVASKKSDIQLTQLKDGSGSTCTMQSSESATILKNPPNEEVVLLRTTSGCQGWAKNKDLEYITQASLAEPPPSCILDILPADANTLYNIQKSLADSIAIYYGDSTLYSYLDSTKFFHHPDDSKFSLRFNAIKDSLYRYYMENPYHLLEHDQFITNKLRINKSNFFFARMEWDSLATIFSLYPDSIFDEVYATNRNLYSDSIKKLSPLKRRSATLALLDYEKKINTPNEISKDTAWYKHQLKMQTLADSIVQEHPQYNEPVYKYHYNMGQIPKRRNPSFYFAAGVSAMHLFGDNESVYGELLGLDLIFLGGFTPIGTFALKSAIAFGASTGKEFIYKDDKKVFKHNSFLSTADISILYRPTISVHNIYNTWAILPEFGTGLYLLDDNIFYYALGIRYEKSMGSQESNAKQPYGIINGWSIGLTSKWSGINFKGIALDIRWALHI